MDGGMSDAILQALIVGGGAFIGAVLGNVVRPVLEHYLHGRAHRARTAADVARSQFEMIYKPLYDMFQNEYLPGGVFEDAVTPEMRDRVVELVNMQRHLAEPALERSVLVIEETVWIDRTIVDTKELRGVWNHVKGRYNALRKRLGLPYTPWWHALSPRRLYWRIWVRRYDFAVARMLRRLRLRKAPARKQDE